MTNIQAFMKKNFSWGKSRMVQTCHCGFSYYKLIVFFLLVLYCGVGYSLQIYFHIGNGIKMLPSSTGWSISN